MQSLHSYSTDISRRKKVIFLIGLLSLTAVTVVEFLFELLPQPGYFGFGVGGLSILLVFQIVYWAFNEHLWWRSVPRRLRLVKVPNLNGTWEGHLESSRVNPNTGQPIRLEGTLEISQHWQDILIEWHGNQSDSYSVGATVLVNKGGWPTVNYQYKNIPQDGTPDSQTGHDGTAELNYIVEDGTEELRGSYYTNREPQTQGEMYFKKT